MLSLSVPSLVSDNAPVGSYSMSLCFFFLFKCDMAPVFFFKKDKIVNQSRMIKPRFLLLRDFGTFIMS